MNYKHVLQRKEYTGMKGGESLELPGQPLRKKSPSNKVSKTSVHNSFTVKRSAVESSELPKYARGLPHHDQIFAKASPSETQRQEEKRHQWIEQ